MRLKHTAPFFPSGRRAGACPGWTPGHALEYRRSHPFRTPPLAGYSTRGQELQPGPLDAVGLRAVLCLP